MSPFAVPAVLALASTGAAAPVRLPDVSVHASGAVGVGGVAFEGNATAWRAGVDAEYWLKGGNLGIGAELAHQEMGTFKPCFNDCMVDATRTAFAASLAVRGNGLESFPLLALAAGAAGGSTHMRFGCDPREGGPIDASGGCSPSGWGPYASFTAAWVLTLGEAWRGGGVFTMGAEIGADVSAVSHTLTWWSEVEWSTTVGLVVGVDLALAR